MLGQHVDRTVDGDGVVNSGLQPGEEGVELASQRSIGGAGLRQNTRDAGDLVGMDVNDIVGPGIPVVALADLLDDPREDRVTHLVLEQHRLDGSPRAVGVVTGLGSGAAEDTDADFALGVLVQVDGVDHRVEPVVMGA